MISRIHCDPPEHFKGTLRTVALKILDASIATQPGDSSDVANGCISNHANLLTKLNPPNREPLGVRNLVLSSFAL